MREEYEKLDKVVMSIWECCELLNEFIDESNPDLDEPQIEHLLQTAEAIRRDYPNENWLHLVGLIHDLGKILLHNNAALSKILTTTILPSTPSMEFTLKDMGLTM
ncbi:hypothetical protein GIB67_025016 [Kingdonia uniflora]|uniref:Inositol oxygenase n=1 Tax=Kingdonia uniflora TaxID=39325 RepID=A0A7J7N7W6_9MAGN|nr:hypothetical protein GIB67_025016 [Kingdonia uniflora]